MKRLLLVLFTILFGITSFAQDDSQQTGNVHIINQPDNTSTGSQEHMTFKNIPITGSADEFIKKLEAAGFTVDLKLEKGAVLKGPFVGYSDCELIIIWTPKTKTVWKVVASLPSQSSWYSVKNRYQEFKDKYTEKYGVPTKSYEFFSKPYYEGDGYELQAFSVDKGNYISFWVSERGAISVSIKASGNSDGCIKLSYEDEIGGILSDKENSAIVDNDI